MNMFQQIASLLLRGESLVLATVLQRSGSTPRAPGSRMVVLSDGSILGSIGGGALEARALEVARAVFQSRRARVESFTLTAEDASRMGMICGGQVKVLIHFVDAAESTQTSLFGDMGKLVDSRGRAWLVTRIPGRDGTVVSLGMGALGGDDGVRGALDAGLTREVVSRFAGRQPDIVEWQGESFLVEPLGREGCVVIFGAGHVSQALAPLARGVGFRTVVCDDREEFANRDRFPSADEVLVLDSFEDPLNGVEIGEESYLVIVTRGHAHDQTVLGRALATTAGYIGMIGSRRKRDAIYGALMEEGFTRADLERVCSPIGLDIGAETPEEIAVSIVAELIQARARRGS